MVSAPGTRPLDRGGWWAAIHGRRSALRSCHSPPVTRNPPSGRWPAIPEGANHFVQVAADQELVVLEVAEPDVIVAIGLGQQRVQVAQLERDGADLSALGLFLGMREDAQSRGRHGFLSSSRSCAVP